MTAKTRISHPLPPVTASERAAHEVVATLQSAGFVGLIVGGAVRDRLLERPVNDVDVATSATPDQIEGLFRKTQAIGKAFGVIIVILDGIQIEVATFRQDAGYSDGRHPDAVVFSTAEDDAARRDFTINALFYDPASEEIVDYVDGLTDLSRGVVRTIGEASRRFEEDYLRMMRAVRFQHDWPSIWIVIPLMPCYCTVATS
jgi:tRNA nucleotidyltransferase/poly(A) polymerase